MTRAALLLVLLATAPVRADMVAPGFHTVPHDFVLTLAGEGSSHAFFLTAYDKVEELSLKAGEPFLLHGPDRLGGCRFTTLVAVPKTLLASADRHPPSAEWLRAKREGVVRSPEIDFIGVIPFYDTRERIIETSRVELADDRIDLTLTDVNAGDPWVRRAWGASGILFAVGVVWLGVWLIRRLPFRRSRVR